LDEAARHFPITREKLIGEIRFYAMRNNACHSGIGRLIDKSKFGALAQRIVDDKVHLEEAFKDYPAERTVVKACITRLEKEWLAVLEADSGVITRPKLTEKAKGKGKRLKARQKSKLSI
jgi:hypothetical protein